MSNASCLYVKWMMFALALAALAAVATPMNAQTARPIQVGQSQITGFPDDWSHHRLVFSNPGTEEEAIKGDRYVEWLKIVDEPRYVIHQLKRGLPVQGPASGDAAAFAAFRASSPSVSLPEDSMFQHGPMPRRPVTFKPLHPISPVKTDWQQPVGSAAPSTGMNYPAKWSFATNTESCANDFVVFATGQAGSGTQATILADYNLYSGCGGTVPEVDWAYNTGTGLCVSLAPVFSLSGNQLAFMQGTGSGSVTATTTGGSKNFTVTTGTIDPCEVGSAISGTGIPGGDTIATVTSSTTGTLTTAATTGGTGTSLTITGQAQLALLRIPLTPPGTGTLSAPAAPTVESSSSSYYSGGAGCTAPCIFTMTLNGSPNDTWSNPYYDYTNDALYVGDAAGKLHKFSPVFKGAPAEITTSPWPVQMARGATNDTNQLASPVYDSVSGYVFVGSTNTPPATTGGYFYAVNASTGAIHGYSSSRLDTYYGIRDAPLFDPVAEEAYVFVGYNSSDDSAVYQFPAAFTSSTTPASETTGTGANSDYAYAFSGAFDNTYYTSSNGATPTGDLYACGTGTGAALYQIPISAGAMQTPVTGPTLDSASYYVRCSPITEFYNTNGVVTPATPATGTVTIATSPSGWSNTFPDSYPTVTIGSTTYTFVRGAPGAVNQVEMHTSSGSGTNNENDTADNLYAVINATSGDCHDAGCVYSGQAANASVTATVSGNVVSLTANTTGTGSDFTLSASLGGNAGALTVSGGNNGANAVLGDVDYLFLTAFAGALGTCTADNADGCVMSFDITTPSSFGTSTTPLGTMDIASETLNTIGAASPGSPTTGIVVDNNGTAAAQSQIYFLTQNNSATTACVSGGSVDGICAIQATQSAP